VRGCSHERRARRRVKRCGEPLPPVLWQPSDPPTNPPTRIMRNATPWTGWTLNLPSFMNAVAPVILVDMKDGGFLNRMLHNLVLVVRLKTQWTIIWRRTRDSRKGIAGVEQGIARGCCLLAGFGVRDVADKDMGRWP